MRQIIYIAKNIFWYVRKLLQAQLEYSKSDILVFGAVVLHEGGRNEHVVAGSGDNMLVTQLSVFVSIYIVLLKIKNIEKDFRTNYCTRIDQLKPAWLMSLISLVSKHSNFNFRLSYSDISYNMVHIKSLSLSPTHLGSSLARLNTVLADFIPSARLANFMY